MYFASCCDGWRESSHALAILLVTLTALAIAVATGLPARFTRGPRTLLYLCVLLTLVMRALMGASGLMLIALVLFAISALMDLETRVIPPDAYTYTAMAICALTSYTHAGLDGMVHALVAQALCYGLTVVAIRYTGMMSGGDIKLAMHFGAVCATPVALMNASIVITLTMLCALTIHAVMLAFQTRSVAYALTGIRSLRVALGPFMLAGVCAAQMLDARIGGAL